MEESKLQDSISTQSESQIMSEAPQTSSPQPESFFIFLYEHQLKSLPFISSLQSKEGSITHSFPYLLASFALRPTASEDNLNLELVYDEKSPFGVVGQLIQVKFASVQDHEYLGSSLKDLLLGLKQRGDIKDISEEAYKYIYKVGDLEGGPIFALTKTNTSFSGIPTTKPQAELCKNQGGQLIEDYCKFIVDTFGKEVALLGLNYLKGGFEQVIEDPFILKFLFDGFMQALPQNESAKYPFEKGSTDKMYFEIEVEKFTGKNMFQIPELQPATGNFSWEHLRDFTQHHNKAV